jgi:hypothetical protein
MYLWQREAQLNEFMAMRGTTECLFGNESYTWMTLWQSELQLNGFMARELELNVLWQ